MTAITTVQIPINSGFDAKRAMELANLIEVAYDEYEVWDYRQTEKDKPLKELPPTTITASEDFADLSGTTVASPLKPTDTKAEKRVAKTNYGNLDSLWHTKKEYQRIDNLWFSEWWWLGLTDQNFLPQLLNKPVGDLLNTITNRVVNDQLLGYVARSQENPDEIFVVFRGTREPAEWINNIRTVPHKFLENEGLGELGEVRNGFNRMYSDRNEITSPIFNFLNKKRDKDAQTVQETITRLFSEQEDLLSNTSKIFITGHSLGAAMATLAALHIKKIADQKNLNPAISLYTFASPRVGDETFAAHFDAIEACYRIINSEDLIQAVPLPTTEIIDDEIFDDATRTKQARILLVKELLKKITGGQSTKHYQHVGTSVTFTKQTGKVAGNHNLTHTYREALKV